MHKIYHDLLQSASYNKTINLTFNQYLLPGNEPLLVHTGNFQQAKTLLPKIEEVLGDKPLKYIFVSHFESDECGGLGQILTRYPKAKTICSAITARELNEVKNISEQQIPNTKLRLKLQEELLTISPELIATGHGECIKL